MKTITFLYAILLSVGLNSSYAQSTWTQQADFGGTARTGAVGFSIGNKGYLGTGNDDNYKNDFWEYDVETNAWTQKADVKGLSLTNASGFSIGSKGYLGTGNDGNYTEQFWEYDPELNVWKKKAKFGPAQKGWYQGVGFSIGGKGYLGAGKVGVGDPQKSFWEYDPLLNTWTKKADFGGSARLGAAGFTIENKAYVGTGSDMQGSYLKDFWEYDPAQNAWTQKASFEGAGRRGAVGFSIGNKGYLGTGYTGANYKKDIWEYDPAVNTWVQKPSLGGTGRAYAVGFSIGNRGYIGTGRNSDGLLKDFWEYTPDAFSGLTVNRDSYEDANTSITKLNESVINNTEHSANVKFNFEDQPNAVSDLSDQIFFDIAHLQLAAEKENQTVQVYPNPLSSSATITFFLKEDNHTTIQLNDLTGRKLQTLLDQDLSLGNHHLTFHRGQLSPGLYLLQVKMGAQLEVRKLVVE